MPGKFVARRPPSALEWNKMKTGRFKLDPQPPAQRKDDPCLYCPCCSTRLTELKCKLLCLKCGYYMSCADYH